MGRDKALLPLGHHTLLTQIAEIGLAAGLRVVVCGRAAPSDWSLPEVHFLLDTQPDEGPLRGLEAALALGDEVLLTACDTPCLRLEAIAWICAQTSAEHGVATIIDGQIQPLFSRYTPACRLLVEKELAAGKRSPLAVVRAGVFTQALAPAAIAVQLADADTPADWQRLGFS